MGLNAKKMVGEHPNKYVRHWYRVQTDPDAYEALHLSCEMSNPKR